MNSRRRRSQGWTRVAVALAAGVVLLAEPARALAGGSSTSTDYYQLTTSQDIAAPPDNASAPQVIATVLPPGSIVPPTGSDGTQLSPLTVLNSSTGFDPNKLIVALKDVAADPAQGTSSSQLFGLSFFGNGFKAGGHLDFALSVDSALKSAPVLQSTTPGISIASIPAPSGGSNTGTTSGTVSGPSSTPQVPEPLSVAIWSAFVGLGLVRARTARKRRAA